MHKVPNGKKGIWEVSDFTVTPGEAKMFNLRSGRRHINPGVYKKLTRNGAVIMSNTPAELQDHEEFIRGAKDSKRILINGLGLGVALSEILKSDTPEEIIIVEKSQDVIDLVADAYLKDKRVGIWVGCAFDYKPEGRFDTVWHDIWDDICEDNLPEMKKLHRKYYGKTAWQGSWCRRECVQCAR